MANAYLGKISAIVTANTSDFNSKLNASAKEVRSFAASMQSALSRAETSAATSLRSIYTEAQKVERALKAAASLRLSFKGIDTSKFKDITQAADQFRRVASAAEQIYKPLSLAAKATESLSNEVRGEFQPALIAAQRQAELMNRALSSGLAVSEKSFARVQRRAEETGQSVRRLAEASQIASSGPRGTELAFAAPRVRDSLTASAAIRQQAANAPASVIEGGTIARDVQKLVTIDNLIQKRRAEVESGILLNIDTTRARASLDSLLAVSEKVRRSISAAITPAAGGNRAEENQLALLQRRSQGEKELEARRAAAAQRSQDNEIALLQRRAQGEKELEARRAAAAQRAEDNEIALLIRREQAGKAAEAARFNGEGTFSPFSAADAGERRVRRGAGGPIPDVGTEVGRTLDVGRQVDNITQRLAATRQQIDALPEGLRTRMIPALQQALNTLVDVERLGARATADQLARANREAERLAGNTARVRRGQNFAEQFGGAGRGGVELNLQEVSLRGYTAQLQILQQTLAGVSTTARGPATGAFDRLRTAISQAAARGTLDLQVTRNEIQRLTTEAVQAAGAVAGVSPRRLAAQLRRAGDIGRGAFGNIGLGVQQAVFAFDDFFSVTGGLDQRIRAAGNNISQLGFVLGGTTGLITGVAVSITAQLIVAFIKWQNAGVGTEDRVKALNDAISRQKSLVGDLASAFSALADEIGSIGFSKPGADAAKFAGQLDEIRKKQREFSTEQTAQIDPEIQRQRGVVAARERSLQTALDPGERVRLNLDIQEARRRERERIAEIEAAPGMTAADAYNQAARARFAVDVESGADEQRAFERLQTDLRGAPNRRPGFNAQDQFAIANNRIVAEQNRLREEIALNTGLGGFESDANIERRRQLASLETTRLGLVEQNEGRRASELEVEVAGSARRAARNIEEAQNKVADAIELGVSGATGFRSELDSMTTRLRDSQTELARAQKAARETGGTADLDASEKAEAQVRAIQSEIDARQQQIDAMSATVRALVLFKDALDVVSQEADQNLQSARSRADEARREDLGRGTSQTAGRRSAAEADFENQRQARNRVDQEVSIARERERVNPRNADIQSQIADIDELLTYVNSLPARQREDLLRERSSLQRQAEEDARLGVENDPAVRAARDDSTRIEQQRQAADRGDDIRRAPAQRAADELAGQLADIRESFGREAEQGAGLVDFAAQREAQQRAVNDAVRSSAPAIFGLADQVQNAIVQGPSRAALNATDVSTVEGSRELNRLLRGDDAAKNQDLVELQKQSQSLETLVQLAREQGVPATLDF